MPAVIFHVSGDRFEPEDVLSRISFEAYRVYRKGDLMRRGKPGALYPDSGFSVELGPQSSDELGDQIAVATAFIARHYNELKQITGADDLRLDFGYEPRRGKDGITLFVQCDYFSPDFLRQCGELGIGIELSLYGVENGMGEPGASPN
jgi:hypothetical protein